mmetsp:Transcript_12757/g.16661  ORF Transcript_12757/g.16661 Transcript_12757/m.16661 type:complete len:513 (-) Transcript_12757:142-1680(-)
MYYICNTRHHLHVLFLNFSQRLKYMSIVGGNATTCEGREPHRRQLVLAQLEDAKNIRREMELALQRVEKCENPSMRRKIFFEQKDLVQQLVSLTQAVRGKYKVEKYDRISTKEKTDSVKMKKKMEAAGFFVYNHLNQNGYVLMPKKPRLVGQEDSSLQDEQKSIKKQQDLPLTSTETSTPLKTIKTKSPEKESPNVKVEVSGSKAKASTKENSILKTDKTSERARLESRTSENAAKPNVVTGIRKKPSGVGDYEQNQRDKKKERKTEARRSIRLDTEPSPITMKHRLLGSAVPLRPARESRRLVSTTRQTSTLSSPSTLPKKVPNEKQRTSQEKLSNEKGKVTPKMYKCYGCKEKVSESVSCKNPKNRNCRRRFCGKCLSTLHFTDINVVNKVPKWVCPICLEQDMLKTRRGRKSGVKSKRCHFCGEMKTNFLNCMYYHINGTKCKNSYCKDCLSEHFPDHPKTSIDEFHAPCCLGTCTCKSCMKVKQLEQARINRPRRDNAPMSYDYSNLY